LPAPLLLGAGVGMVAILALAVVRYDVAVAVGMLLLPIVRVEPAPVDGVFAVIIALSAVTGRLELRRVPLSMTAFAGSFLALILVQEALRPRLLRLNRAAQVACFLALAAGIVFSYSRAAWLNLVVGVAVMVVVTGLRRGGSGRVFALMIVVVVALAALSTAIV